MGILATNYNVLCIKTIFGVESSLHQNKTLEYFRLISSALVSKNKKQQKWKKRKIKVTLEMLQEVSAEFPETKKFIDQKLEEKFCKEKISIEEVIYFFDTLRNKHLLLFRVLGQKIFC